MRLCEEKREHSTSIHKRMYESNFLPLIILWNDIYVRENVYVYIQNVNIQLWSLSKWVFEVLN